MLVDSHCHLQLLPRGLEVGEVVAAAREAGVDRLLCVSVDLQGYPAMRELIRPYARVWATVGVHPNHETPSEAGAEDLAELAADPAVLAVGETGLDYYRDTCDPELQRRRFRTHIRAARMAGKPLVIHCRAAAPELLGILEEEGAREVGGIMHCFVEDWESAARAMALGFLISFSGILTFRNAAEVREVAARVPSDFLLVETDAPYLAPVPHRGKSNQPAFVRHTAEVLARLRGVSLEHLAEQTSANFSRLLPAAA